MNDTDNRTAYTDGLRAIADLLDQHPDVELPCATSFSVVFWGDDAATQIAAARRDIGGAWEKHSTEGYFWLSRPFGPHTLDLMTERERVCERVVTGTETVQVADPAAPLVTVQRDTFQWVCSPLLDDVPVAS